MINWKSLRKPKGNKLRTSKQKQKETSLAIDQNTTRIYIDFIANKANNKETPKSNMKVVEKISLRSSTIAVTKMFIMPKTLSSQKTRNSLSNLYIGDC